MAFRAFSLLWKVFLLALIAQCKADAGTTCEANHRRVAVGENTAITCNFGRDVSQSKHNIVVQLYPPSSREPVSVLKCNWLVRNPDEPTCTVHSGCSFTSVNDTLRIDISNATKEFEGTYRCQLVPSDGIRANACSLTVTDGPPPEEDQGTRGNGTLTPNNDLKLPADESKIHLIALAVTSGFAIISVLLNVALLLAVYLWRRKGYNMPSKDENVYIQASSDSGSSSDSSDSFIGTQNRDSTEEEQLSDKDDWGRDISSQGMQGSMQFI